MANISGNGPLNGTSNSDVIIGGSGDDALTGLGGADTLEGGGGNDILNGGVGTDTASYASAGSGVTVSLAITTAQNTLGAGTDTLSLIENLTGSAFGDTLTGDTGTNYISGAGGDDTIYGGGAPSFFQGDTLDGGAGSDTVDYHASTIEWVMVNLMLFDGFNGAPGDPQSAGSDGFEDTLISIENIIGSSGEDDLRAIRSVVNGPGSYIDAGAGDDQVFSGLGNDTLVGGAGWDIVNYYYATFFNTGGVTVDLRDQAHQTASGGMGFDIMSGFDRADGTDFDDLIYAPNVSEGPYSVILGEGGNDRLVSGLGADAIEGGDGIDTADYSLAASAVTIVLYDPLVSNGFGGFYDPALQTVTGGGGSDSLFQIENAIGSAFDDSIRAIDSTLNGAGSRMEGLAGADHLISEKGNDTLDGGAGADTADYIHAGSAVIVNLGVAGAQITGGGGTDTLISIEGVIGSNFNDILTGDGGDNTLRGGAGADTIDGGAGIDTAVFSNNRSEYTLVTTGKTTTVTISTVTDTLTNVEFFQFLDQTISLNNAPTVASTQIVAATTAVGKAITVAGTDIDGDLLTYTAGAASKGAVTGGAGGVFTYTSNPGAVGADTFAVTVKDPGGLSAIQTVTVNITAPGDTTAPTAIAFSPSKGATGQPLATDVTISFSEAVARGTGQIRITTSGGTLIETYDAATSNRLAVSGSTLTINPTNDLSGGSGYLVSMDAGTVADLAGNPYAGLSGYAFTTLPTATTGQDYQLSAAAGFSGAVGGAGHVFGTTGFQDIHILNQPGQITLDASFNAGGDRIHLDGNAAGYTAIRSGSTVVVSDGDTSVIIPLGLAATDLYFDDGVRGLLFDAQKGAPAIGGQSIGASAVAITAAAAAPTTTDGTNVSATARLSVGDASPATVVGNVSVFGNTQIQSVTIGAGKGIVQFDASFNGGADTIHLIDPAANWLASRSGSMVILVDGTSEVRLPVGTAGLTLDFHGDARSVIFDPVGGHILIGQQVIDVTSAPLIA